MLFRSLIASVSALTFTVGAAAEPLKAPAQQQASAAHPAPIVLASADEVVPAAPTTHQDAPPVKRRAMRVTTCRCGDPAPRPQESR